MENKPDAVSGFSEIISGSVPPANPEAEDVDMAVCGNSGQENGMEDVDQAYITQALKTEIKDIELHEKNIKLLKLVKEYPCLYDRNHTQYNDPIHKSNVWQDIAYKMNKKRPDVKKRFASLYQLFGNIYFMLRDPEMVAEGFPMTDFLLYEYMFFLKDHIDVEKAKKRIAAIFKNFKNPSEKPPPQQEKKKVAPATQPTPKVSKKTPKMMKNSSSQRLQPYQRFLEVGPPFPMRPNMPGPGPSQFFHDNNSFPPPPQFNSHNAPMPPPPMDMGFRRDISSPPMYPGNFNGSFDYDRDNFEGFEDAPDDFHVDFFFKGIAQQVKNSNISDRNFLDLQSTILTALTCKLSNYHK